MLQWFSGGQAAKGQAGTGETTSLLADWNSYSNTGASRDVEAGASTSASTQEALFQSVENAGQTVSNFFSQSITTVQRGVQSGVAALPTTESFSIPSGQQLMYFFAFVTGGGVFLLLAFMLFLPVIILSPSKFALSFTIGCMLIMAGFGQLRGWSNYVQHMLSAERLPFSAAYLGSIGATLYAALIMHSYLLSLLCSGLQVVALLYYIMSYFPGGAQGAKFLVGMLGQALMSCFGSVQRMVLK